MKRAAKSGRNVTQVFTVGYTVDFGYTLSPVGKPLDIRFVSFVDTSVRDAFRHLPETPVGHKLACECTGVPWTYSGQQHFIVRSAKFKVID